MKTRSFTFIESAASFLAVPGGAWNISPYIEPPKGMCMSMIDSGLYGHGASPGGVQRRTRALLVRIAICRYALKTSYVILFGNKL